MMDAVSSEDSSAATPPTSNASDEQTTTALDRVRVRDFIGWTLGTTAGMFAMMHGHVLGAFAFGVVTTLLYVQTRSLWAPIVMHAVGNLINIPGVLPVRSGFEAATGVTDAQTFGGACLAVSIPLLVWFVVRHWTALFSPLPYLEHPSPSS